jgi:hypothetical protein
VTEPETELSAPLAGRARGTRRWRGERRDYSAKDARLRELVGPEAGRANSRSNPVGAGNCVTRGDLRVRIWQSTGSRRVLCGIMLGRGDTSDLSARVSAFPMDCAAGPVECGERRRDPDAPAPAHCRATHPATTSTFLERSGLSRQRCSGWRTSTSVHGWRCWSLHGRSCTGTHCPCRKSHPPWWGSVHRVSRNLAVVARADTLAQLLSARHDDRSCCCDWLTWV